MIFLDQILGNLRKRSDTDFIDRLNYYYTPMLIVFFGLTLSAKQYVGQPIQCWVPAQFTGAWEQYSEYFCFVQNTYFVPFHEDLPTTYEERDRREIGYYQWVPFILALQAFLFFFPVMVWRLLNWQSGICVKTLVNAAVDVHNVEDDTCRKNTDLVARHMKSSLEIQHRLEPRGNLFSSLFYGKHYGCYVSTLYLFIKFLFIVNVVLQFFILNSFLGSRYTFWGFEILRDIWIGREWTESGHFPRVTMCDFKVRVLGNLHNWSIQCVLQINMFNEKIYLFLWWWFLLVGIINFINFFYWCSVTIVRKNRRDFVLRYLKVYDDIKRTEPDGEKRFQLEASRVNRFLDQYVRPDGVFVLRMIAANAGHIMTTNLTGRLWDLVYPIPEDSDVKEEKEKKIAPEKPPKPSAPLPPPTTPDYGFQETLDDNIDGHSSPESKALLQNPV